jgi:hypothetical protein
VNQSEKESVRDRKTRIAKLELQLAALRSAESKAERERDTREKIIIGGTVKAVAATDPQLRRLLVKYLDECVTRPNDRKVIETWLPTTSTQLS